MRCGQRWFPNGEWVVLVALLAEIAVFAAIAPRFASVANFVEVLRLSVELGLLAVALTPVVISGGIDLSVGCRDRARGRDVRHRVSRLETAARGRCGVRVDRRGALRRPERRADCAAGTAAVDRHARIVVGLSRHRRGHHAGGATTSPAFRRSFLQFGQGYLWDVIPAQLPVLLVALAGYWVLLHRSVLGRALYTIGFTPAGARYAGIPVARRVALLYVLSGLMAGVAALIYVAHLGQARSDAGNGYELDAVTAVVLGGTSIYGGRGTLGGTLLGCCRSRS